MNKHTALTEVALERPPRGGRVSVRARRVERAVRLAPETLAPASGPIGGPAKRAFDAMSAFAGLVFLSPLLLLVALIIRLETPGEAIFRQERGGFGGRKFKIWKFRTMTCAECGGTARQAQRGDGRITRFGAFLRKTSIDELPQLVNVLMGDMSLIGPRPHALRQDADFARVDPRYPMRALARPGITGLAQVTGLRGPTDNDASIIARTSQDLTYIESWSPWLDVRILTRTLLFAWNDPHAF